MVVSCPICFTRLSAAVSEFLRLLLFSRFRPEVVSGARGRGKMEVTSQFDSSTPFLYQWSVDIFCLSHSVQRLFNILV
jgi:hypothetical protein